MNKNSSLTFEQIILKLHDLETQLNSIKLEIDSQENHLLNLLQNEDEIRNSEYGFLLINKLKQLQKN